MTLSCDPAELFHQCVPTDFLHDTIRCLVASYAEAWEECRVRFPWTEAHDVLGHIRRATFESQWRAIATRYSGLKASTETNASGNCFHTVISAGRVLITASKVDDPRELVRDAIFRQTYAKSCQGFLIEELAEPEPPPDAPLYAILIHSPSSIQSIPKFAHVVFPAPDCRSYLGRIRLEVLFPELFSGIHDSDIENVNDEAQVTLRDDIGKQDRKNA